MEPILAGLLGLALLIVTIASAVVERSWVALAPAVVAVLLLREAVIDLSRERHEVVLTIADAGLVQVFACFDCFTASARVSST